MGDGVQVLCVWLLVAVVEQLTLVLLGVGNDCPRALPALSPVHGFGVELVLSAGGNP